MSVNRVFVPHCGVALCAQSPAELRGSSPVVASFTDIKLNPAFLFAFHRSLAVSLWLSGNDDDHTYSVCVAKTRVAARLSIFIYASTKSGTVSLRPHT